MGALAVEAVAHLLGHFGEMAVEVVHVVGVDALAQVGHVLVGSAHVEGVGAGEAAVHLVAGGSAREEVDFVGTSLSVFFLSDFGYSR